MLNSQDYNSTQYFIKITTMMVHNSFHEDNNLRTSIGDFWLSFYLKILLRNASICGS